MLPDLCAEDNLLLRVQVALSMHLLQIAKNNKEPLLSVVQSAVHSARSNLKLGEHELVRLPLTSILSQNEHLDENCVDQQSLTTFVESDSLHLDRAESCGYADSVERCNLMDCGRGDLSSIEFDKTHESALKHISSDSEIKTKIGHLCSTQLELLSLAGEDLKSCFEQDYETIRMVVQMMIGKVPDLEGRLLSGLDDMLKEIEDNYRESFVDYLDELLLH